MSLFSLAVSNFKRSVREFAMLVLSLAFSVFIFFNFQNVIYSRAMDVLLEFRKDLIDSVIQAASIVFVVFLFFFIWYATNVFLNQRKKEIGIYGSHYTNTMMVELGVRLHFAAGSDKNIKLTT